MTYNDYVASLDDGALPGACGICGEYDHATRAHGFALYEIQPDLFIGDIAQQLARSAVRSLGGTLYGDEATWSDILHCLPSGYYATWAGEPNQQVLAIFPGSMATIGKGTQ